MQIDVWRGLCLVDVVLVHLAYNGLGFPEPLDQAIKHYTRFAAGGFVFLAGLTVATVFAPRVEHSPARRWDAYRALWRRSLLLVFVDVVASVAFRLLDLARRFPFDPDTPLAEALWSIVTLQRPGLTGGILLFYAIILAPMPLVFELQRRAGRLPILALTLGVYIAAVTSGGILHWPPYDFPVGYWQVLFFAGFLTAGAYEWLSAGWGRRLAWLAGALAAFGLVFVEVHGAVVGVEHWQGFWNLDFRKTPLQPGALLWYAAAVQVVLASSALLWKPLAASRVGAWLALLGRHSLFVYTAHVFTEAVVLELVWSHWPPALIRCTLALADVAVLAAACRLLEQQHELGVGIQRSPQARELYRVLPRFLAPGMAVAALLLFLRSPSEMTETTAFESPIAFESAAEPIAHEGLSLVEFSEPDPELEVLDPFPFVEVEPADMDIHEVLLLHN
jgi:hypothetical protein